MTRLQDEDRPFTDGDWAAIMLSEALGYAEIGLGRVPGGGCRRR